LLRSSGPPGRDFRLEPLGRRRGQRFGVRGKDNIFLGNQKYLFRMARVADFPPREGVQPPSFRPVNPLYLSERVPGEATLKKLTSDPLTCYLTDRIRTASTKTNMRTLSQSAASEKVKITKNVHLFSGTVLRFLAFLLTIAAGQNTLLAAESQTTLAISIRTLSSPYQVMYKVGAEAYAKQLGLPLDVLTTEANSQKGLTFTSIRTMPRMLCRSPKPWRRREYTS
jgi:hypothetical protein